MDTWTNRDLPVLRAIVALADEGHDYFETSELAERTGLDEAKVQLGLWALAAEEPPFFSWKDHSTFGGREIGSIRMPTGHARRKVGAWPTPETLADQIVAALQQAADNEPDETKRGKLRDAAQRLTESVVSGVLTTWASGALG